jgi:ATP adenylyltransferase
MLAEKQAQTTNSIIGTKFSNTKRKGFNLEKPLFEMRHTRVVAQHNRMAECIKLGLCPFCWENLEKYHDAPVLMQGKFWAITANDYPYKGTRLHFLAIYYRHISSMAELEPGAGDELFVLFNKLCKEHEIIGATVIMRSGEMKYTGATVFHLHAQIMSGASLDEFTEKPNFPDDVITTVLGYKVPKSK